MWETPFSEDMLTKDCQLIIYCPDEDAAEQLFKILRSYGVRWGSGALLESTHWRDSVYNCYFLRGEALSRGNRFVAEASKDLGYRRFTTCTYFGENFEPSSREELFALLQPSGR